MTVAKTRIDLHPLCYEHHLEMKLVQIQRKRNSYRLAHTCPKPDCLIHYDGPVGYFVINSTPGIRCPRHGVPMYLAEVQPRRRSFRLWRCPLSGCKASLTNERGLV